MRPGDLCKLVGTMGLGELCLVLEENANGAGAVKVLLDTGATWILSPFFLRVIDETR